jgi:hypothetical protein
MKFKNLVPIEILGMLSQDSNAEVNLSIVGSSTPQSTKPNWYVSAENLISKLSYSHLVELIKIQDDIKRTFYEIECIKDTWSVKELKRQINCLYFERRGISKKPAMLSEIVKQKAETMRPDDIVKSVYAF